MLNRIFFFPIMLGLAYGLWASNEFRIVAAGVAIFLFGMVYLEDGFKMFTGSVLERRLRHATGGVFRSITFGLVSTAILQSSSLVSVIVISFLSAGLISLTAGVGIILGSNLGSTTGAWLIALYGMKINLSVYAMPLLVFGLLFNVNTNRNIKGVGLIFLAVGFIFLGIDYMKEGFAELQGTIDLAQFGMSGILGLLVYMVIGVFATAVMQSTNAVLVLVFSALALHQISYENAVAVSIGANVGTTATAILGAIRANAQGKRLAVAHLLFNVGTALLALIFFQPLLSFIDYLVDMVSFIDSEDSAVKLALFHSIFNVMGIFLMLPFIENLVAYLNLLFCKKTPENQNLNGMIERAKFLNPAVMDYPDAALQAMTKECILLYRRSSSILCYGVFLTREKLRETDNVEELVNVWKREQQDATVKTLYARSIKGVYGDIIKYGSVLDGRLTVGQSQEVFSVRISCRNFVRAIKHIEIVYNNMALYIESENIEIKFQYNQLRICLAKILKDLDRLLKSINILGTKCNYGKIEGQIDKMRHALYEQDRLMHASLNALVSARSVDENMASSLLDDSAHILDACNCMIDGVIGVICRHQDDYKTVG